MLPGYQLLRRLSDGAAAEVLMARSPSDERVLVEVLRPELRTKPDLVERFLDEIDVHRALLHPNLVRRDHEGMTADGRPYLVSEPVGESLAARLFASGPLAPGSVIELAVALCEAVQFLHDQGMVHGNIKPATVFLPAGGGTSRPKLVDYGLALLRPGGTTIRSHAILVEAEYLAPERVRGQRGTTSSDVYALGVLMYEALTGSPPFAGHDSSRVRRKQLEERPAPLPANVGRLAAIVERCLAKDPAERFSSARALRRALTSGELSPEALEAASTPLVGSRALGDCIGNYELLQPLGEGSMGRVFLARHRKLGRMVALKILKPEAARSPELVERFFQEARAVNRIRHEHIVEIFDFSDEEVGPERRVWCVMEALDGRTLRQRLKEGPVPIGPALALLRQVCSALEAAHRVGVVHRDVKPDNIFLVLRDGADFVKVLDFGVAKLREGGVEPARDEQGAPLTAEDTAHGIVVGTPMFMAPEQVMGKAADYRADVYAVGVVLYLMLAGKAPFFHRDVPALFEQIALTRAPPLPDRSASDELIPARLRELVLGCLEKDPERRPQSMAELGVALESIHAELESAAAPKPKPEVVEPADEPTEVADLDDVTELAELADPSDLRRQPWKLVWFAVAALAVAALLGLAAAGLGARSAPAPRREAPNGPVAPRAAESAAPDAPAAEPPAAEPLVAPKIEAPALSRPANAAPKRPAFPRTRKTQPAEVHRDDVLDPFAD